GGQVYLTGMPDEGRVSVRWGAGQQQQCTADVSVTGLAGPAGVYSADAVCRDDTLTSGGADRR
ncbi:TPA: FimD/PapC C-terminal domain-containing protein, partial [Salmonella enterica subsp. enterica serovar Muenchen]